jgi:hypothetical protein
MRVDLLLKVDSCCSANGWKREVCEDFDKSRAFQKIMMSYNLQLQGEGCAAYSINGAQPFTPRPSPSPCDSREEVEELRKGRTL